MLYHKFLAVPWLNKGDPFNMITVPLMYLHSNILTSTNFTAMAWNWMCYEV